ncbi:hypothetical protein C0J52_07165 [Blattella germanica]|nr:hypothetical protein C0J52_07165 [Blattella germanica]
MQCCLKTQTFGCNELIANLVQIAMLSILQRIQLNFKCNYEISILGKHEILKQLNDIS